MDRMHGTEGIKAGAGSGTALIRLTGAVVLFIGPALYVIGTWYWTERLTALGYEPSSFRFAPDQLIYQGFEAPLIVVLERAVPLLPPAWAVTSTITLLMIVAYGCLLLWGKAYAFRTSLAQSLSRRVDGARDAIWRTIVSYLFASTWLLGLAAVVLVLLLLMLPIYLGGNIGKVAGNKEAARLVEASSSGNYRKNDKFVIGRDGQSRLLVVCASNGCGVYGLDGPEFWPWERIDRITPAKSKTDKTKK